MEVVVHYFIDDVYISFKLNGSRYIPRVDDIIRLKEVDLVVKRVVYDYETEHPIIINVYCDFCQDVVTE